MHLESCFNGLEESSMKINWLLYYFALYNSTVWNVALLNRQDLDYHQWVQRAASMRALDEWMLDWDI